jgi:DNA polymerase-3 subunit delta
MSMATFDSIITELSKKQYHPLYLLMGDEPYYIDQITDYITKNVMSEAEKSFNFTTFYGKDTDVHNVIDASKRFPMMSAVQVVLVREAQELKGIEDLHFYAEKPLKSTLLVLAYKYGKYDKRKKLYKAVEQNGVIFESAKLREDKIPDWVVNYLKNKGKSIEPPAALLLTEFLGNDLSKIANELDKLLLVLSKDIKTITSAHIEKNIGFSKDFNAFELTKALGQKNILKANRIIDYLGSLPDSRSNFPGLMSILFNYFAKLMLYHSLPDKSRNNVASALGVNPFFVQEYEVAAKRYSLEKTAQVISFLRLYDLKMKGVGNTSTPTSELMRELIFKILH